jgi:hypothetical protein
LRSEPIINQGVVQVIQAKQVTVESILHDLARALAGAEDDKDRKGMVFAAIGRRESRA